MLQLIKTVLFVLINLLPFVPYSFEQITCTDSGDCISINSHYRCLHSPNSWGMFTCQCLPGYETLNTEPHLDPCIPYFGNACVNNQYCGPSEFGLECNINDNSCRCQENMVYDPSTVRCWPILDELFGPCGSSTSMDSTICDKFGNEATCFGDIGTDISKCVCTTNQTTPTGFSSLDLKSCLSEVTELNDRCNLDNQCATRIANSVCFNDPNSNPNPQYYGLCKCQEGYFQDGSNNCLPQSTVRPNSSTTQQPTTTIEPTMPVTMDKECKESDQYGNLWEADIGELLCKPCPREDLAKNVTCWQCGNDGQFIGKTPDYSNCTTRWIIDGVSNVTEAFNNGTLNLETGSEFLFTFDAFITQAISSSTEDPGNENAEYFGHEINAIFSSVQLILDSIKSSNETLDRTKLERFTDSALNVSAKVLKFQKPWEQLPTVNRTKTFYTATYLLESTALQFAQSVATEEVPEGTKYVKSNYPGGGSDIFIAAGLTTEQSGSLLFPPNNKQNEGKDSFINLPSNWYAYIKKEKNSVTSYQDEIPPLTSFVGMEMDSNLVKFNVPSVRYEDQKQLFTGSVSSRDMNSKMLSFSINDPKESVFFGGEEVEVTLLLDRDAWANSPKKIRRNLRENERPRAAGGSSSPQCIFYNASLNSWSSNGCRLIKSGPFSITCACNHLSAFTVLSEFHQYIGKSLSMEVVTAIFYGGSALFMIIQICLKPPRVNDLHQNQNKIVSVLVLIGNILLILFVDKYYLNLNSGACQSVGILSHLIFLISFSFLLTCTLDMILNLKRQKRILSVGDPSMPSSENTLNFVEEQQKIIYFIFILGIPCFIIIVTVVSDALAGGNSRAYGGEFCWLDGSYVWSFYIPAILISLSNGILLVYLKLYISTFDSYGAKDPAIAQSNELLVSNIKFSLLLGLTWLVGFFEIGPNYAGSSFVGFLFPILNGLQGAMVLHCTQAPGQGVLSLFKSFLSQTPGENVVPDSGHISATEAKSHRPNIALGLDLTGSEQGQVKNGGLNTSSEI